MLNRQLLNTIKTLPKIFPCVSSVGRVLLQFAHFAQYQEKIPTWFYWSSNVEWESGKVPMTGFVSGCCLSTIQSAARKSFKRRFLASVDLQAPFRGNKLEESAALSGFPHIFSLLSTEVNKVSLIFVHTFSVGAGRDFDRFHIKQLLFYLYFCFEVG